MVKSSVIYNKSQKEWEASNGNGFHFSDANKARVLLKALYHDQPQIYKAVRQICFAVSRDANGHGIPRKFSDRIFKAASLVAKGNVDIQTMQVQSQNGGGTYQVSFEGIPKTWHCTCPDFAKGGFDTSVCQGGYGIVCKHILAIMIARALGGYSPHPNAYESQQDFLQGMTDRQARRIYDPEYIKALEHGDDGLFWYIYGEILSQHTQQLYWQCQDVLRISEFWDERRVNVISDRSKEVTVSEIRSSFLSGHKFLSIFEFPDLDDGDYSEFWRQSWNFTHNGQLSRMKEELIQAFEELL